MSSAFYPIPIYRHRLPRDGARPIRALCDAAGVPCRASGPWAERPVRLTRGEVAAIIVEPGGYGQIEIRLAPGVRQTPADEARYALCALAYGLLDGVARATIAGQLWARLTAPRGRPVTGAALSTAERQRRFKAAARDR